MKGILLHLINRLLMRWVTCSKLQAGRQRSCMHNLDIAQLQCLVSADDDERQRLDACNALWQHQPVALAIVDIVLCLRRVRQQPRLGGEPHILPCLVRLPYSTPAAHFEISRQLTKCL